MLIDPKWTRLVSIYTGAALVKIALFVGALLLGRKLDAASNMHIPTATRSGIGIVILAEDQ